ncbi:MAG: pyridoxal-phosphate dependent enzyme [Candidatus Bathyarchaeota archaeon]|nr:pyridoxal-phosphate dependent enzyme [Candidatus Bathyarchaeota archaeon]MCX8177678.1 pyridoxal-phosphate dependent enzyme [Candidatus Bathyarchaeota archaeon]MDW8193932.1 ubiquitin-like small modifier protein 1 [Nitrososphaerota archaeon]
MGSIKVKFYGVLAEAVQGREANVEASTLQQLLSALAAKYGNSFKEKIYNSDGTLRRFINIYVNGKDVRFIHGVDTKLNDGDEVLFIPAVSGGSQTLKGEVELTDIKNVKPAAYMDIREALPLYARILSTKAVTRPVVVDENTGVVLDGYEVFYALDLLSAEKIPVIKANLSSVKLTSLQSGLKPVTAESIIKAGINGPKLPPKSFKVSVEIPEINVSLKDLLPPPEKNSHALKVYNSTLELLYKGWPTPLVKLNSLSNERRSVWAKLEGYNPFSNSVKDRIGWSMLLNALEQGELKGIIYEATSTNTGIALTSIANTLGVNAKLFIPKTIQRVSDIYLKVLGADVVRLPVGLTVEAIGQVDSKAKEDKTTHLNQFENDANLKVHLKYTAKELDDQLLSVGLKPTAIIGGLGTSGHMSAISLYFKNKYGDEVKIVGVQPAPNEVIPGIRRIETGMKWYHWTFFDEIVDVRQREAIEAAINVARREGLLIGLSAGAVTHALNKIVCEEGVYVLIFPDTGYKYAEQFENYFTNLQKEQKGEG